MQVLISNVKPKGVTSKMTATSDASIDTSPSMMSEITYMNDENVFMGEYMTQPGTDSPTVMVIETVKPKGIVWR